MSREAAIEALAVHEYLDESHAPVAVAEAFLDWLDGCSATTKGALAAYLSDTEELARPGLDVERLSIAMNRAFTYGTGTAEQVAAEYAALTQHIEEEDQP